MLFGGLPIHHGLQKLARLVNFVFATLLFLPMVLLLLLDFV